MNKNEEKFIRYMTKYEKLITFIVRKNMLKYDDWYLAEDIGQETFLRMYRHIDYLSDETVFFWLIAVANNLVRDYRKKGGKYNEEVTDDEKMHTLLDAFESQESAEEVFEQNVMRTMRYDLIREIGAALYEKDPRWSYIMIDAEILNMSSKEIAQALNISVTYVDVIRSRARKYVKKRFGDKVLEYFGEGSL